LRECSDEGVQGEETSHDTLVVTEEPDTALAQRKLEESRWKTWNIQEIKTSNDTDHDIQGCTPESEIRLHVGGFRLNHRDL